MFGLGRHHDALLGGLASVVAGTVDRDGHLHGSVGGRALEVWFQRLDPTPLTPQHYNPVYAEVLRLNLQADGHTPWYVRSEALLTHPGRHAYEFVREVATDVLLRFSPVRDLIATQDPEVESRLRQAGLFEAITAFAPPSRLWLPRIRFTPDPRAAIMERMRHVPVPEGVESGPSGPNTSFGLSIDVERDNNADPTPERFAAMLRAALYVAEFNEHVNPAL